MSRKYKYTAEYEINASNKMLYPYLSTPKGLSEWFADKVVELRNGVYDIVWDNESHLSKIVSKRTNAYVKYQFMAKNEAEASEEDLSYLEFKLDFNELTQTSFFKVVDYSEMTDDRELRELWNNLISKLKELVGSAQNSSN